MLPPLLDDNMKIVFIGTEPGAESERIGHYYAGANNSFYRDLKDAGCTEEIDRPEQDILLFQRHNIGLDDVYHDKEALVRRPKRYKPGIVCFNSKEALKHFSGKRINGQWWDANASRYALFSWNPTVWFLYDSSGMARRYRSRRVELLRELLSYV